MSNILERLKEGGEAGIKRMNKPQLRDALFDLMKFTDTCDRDVQSSKKDNDVSDDNLSSIILSELRDMRQDYDEHSATIEESVSSITTQCSMGSKRVDEVEKFIEKQKVTMLNMQIALEQVFAHQRASNLIVHGVPEDTGLSDVQLVKWMFTLVENEKGLISVKRLGAAQDFRNSRPLIVICESPEQRNGIVRNGKMLKDAGKKEYGEGICIEWNNVYVKKDVHPAIRKEWGRLRSVEKTEKEKPENSDCEIYLDHKSRQLLKDGIVIDSWSMKTH